MSSSAYTTAHFKVFTDTCHFITSLLYTSIPKYEELTPKVNLVSLRNAHSTNLTFAFSSRRSVVYTTPTKKDTTNPRDWEAKACTLRRADRRTKPGCRSHLESSATLSVCADKARPRSLIDHFWRKLMPRCMVTTLRYREDG